MRGMLPEVYLDVRREMGGVAKAVLLRRQLELDHRIAVIDEDSQRVALPAEGVVPDERGRGQVVGVEVVKLASVRIRPREIEVIHAGLEIRDDVGIGAGIAVRELERVGAGSAGQYVVPRAAIQNVGVSTSTERGSIGGEAP
jgi:hypothetical protein